MTGQKKAFSTIIARLFLFAAIFCPTLLILLHESIPIRSLNMLAWALCANLIFASLPGRYSFWFSLLFLWLTLPVTFWWIGFTSLNGIGPGWESAQAALRTNQHEIFEALNSTLAIHGFLTISGLHILFLVLATFIGIRSKNLPEPRGIKT